MTVLSNTYTSVYVQKYIHTFCFCFWVMITGKNWKFYKDVVASIWMDDGWCWWKKINKVPLRNYYFCSFPATHTDTVNVKQVHLYLETVLKNYFLVIFFLKKSNNCEYCCAENVQILIRSCMWGRYKGYCSFVKKNDNDILIYESH